MVLAHVVRRIRLDHVCAKLHGLTDERENLRDVAVHHVPPRLLIGAEYQGLDHEGHPVDVAVGLDPEYILYALVGDTGLIRDPEQVHDDAHRIQPERLFHGTLDHAAEKQAGETRAIHVGNIGPENERGLLLPGDRLEHARLSDRELYGIRPRRDERVHALDDVLDPPQKPELIEEPVIDCHVKASTGRGVNQPAEAVLVHRCFP